MKQRQTTTPVKSMCLQICCVGFCAVALARFGTSLISASFAAPLTSSQMFEVSGSTCAPTTHPINVYVAVDGDGTLMQGEPLVLRASITDAAGAETKVHFAFREDDWLQMRLEIEKGEQSVQVIDTLNFPRPLNNPDGGKTVLVLAGAAQKQVRVLRPEWLGDPAPGRYRLYIRVQLPYSRASDLKALEEASGPVFTKEIVVPMTIVKVKPSVLRAKAAEMRGILLDKTAGSRKDLAAEILYALPDEYAQVERDGMLRDRRANGETHGYAYLQTSRLEKLNRPDIARKRRNEILQMRNAAEQKDSGSQ